VAHARESVILEEQARCRAAYEAANNAYMTDLTAEAGRAVTSATKQMNECLHEVEQRGREVPGDLGSKGRGDGPARSEAVPKPSHRSRRRSLRVRNELT
jgi:hypothetical protein